MLVMRCENSRGEKSSKAAHKTHSHAHTAKLEPPHSQIALPFVAANWVCIGVCVSERESSRRMCSITADEWMHLCDYPECKSTFWLRPERQEPPSRAAERWESALLQLPTITHVYASASCCFMLRGCYTFLSFTDFYHKWAFTNEQPDLAVIKVQSVRYRNSKISHINTPKLYEHELKNKGGNCRACGKITRREGSDGDLK